MDFTIAATASSCQDFCAACRQELIPPTLTAPTAWIPAQSLIPLTGRQQQLAAFHLTARPPTQVASRSLTSCQWGGHGMTPCWYRSRSARGADHGGRDLT